MNTTQKITKAANAQGLITRTEGNQFVLLHPTGLVVGSATIEAGRFHGGYVLDAAGHVVTHSTLRDFVAAI